MAKKTMEPQYQSLVSLRAAQGLTPLGLHANQIWNDDPRRFLIMLSRYKFIAKMLSGKKNVLEVGCGDAFGSRLVLQEVGALTAVDFDPIFIEDVRERMEDRWKFDCRVHDIIKGPVPGKFDAAYSLDVLEHIPKRHEDRYMSHICRSLTDRGVLIVGIPSIQSQAHASQRSKQGHVNCKNDGDFRKLILKYFDDCFLFSMNDEVVHTGYYPMAHYLLALASGKKRSPKIRP